MRVRLLFVAVFAILADMFDRHHMLIIRRIEHANALGSAAGDADAFHRHSDQLPAIAHQHDLIRHFDRESSHEMADLADVLRHGDRALIRIRPDRVVSWGLGS